MQLQLKKEPHLQYPNDAINNDALEQILQDAEFDNFPEKAISSELFFKTLKENL
jgi:hypothetical protein